MSTHVPRRTVLAGAAAVAAAGAAVAVSGSPAAATGNGPKPTIVLVHGAFADATGWSDVITRLTHAGYPVIAPPNPLRGVASDSAYLRDFLTTVTGPVVLAGHSYGGVLITNAATDNASVKALVYIAAFAPDAGETVFGLQNQFPGTLLTQDQLEFRPWPGGIDGYVRKEAFRAVFAGDLPASTTDVMWAAQRPGDTSSLQEASGAPAWKTIPSFYLVAKEDRLIPAAAQRFMARRAGAHTVEVKASHVAMISQPRITADLIRRAAR
ncbi:alpha/beta hydrolase [Actinoplanes sp. NPDC051861]|uniref:alpha/beta fold hydrolase n=1 Tax=Actinoplanes sp. NPDC051861 TaxID=3155170 RepID=UPI0034266D7B